MIVLTYGYDRKLLYRLAPYRIDDYHIKPLSAPRLAQRIQSVVADRQPVGAPVGSAAISAENCQEAKSSA